MLRFCQNIKAESVETPKHIARKILFDAIGQRPLETGKPELKTKTHSSCKNLNPAY